MFHVKHDLKPVVVTQYNVSHETLDHNILVNSL